MKKENSYHTWGVEEGISNLETNIQTGLSIDEVQRRILIWKKNRIDEAKNITLFQILIKQINNPMSYLLLFASLLSFTFREFLDAYAILIVLAINILIGFWMEWQSEISMSELKKLALVKTKVLRSGEVVEVHSEEIVPGDILIVEAGDMITADARILECKQLQTIESALTGESLPIEKSLDTLAETCMLAERSNMLYKGTFVCNGNAKALVVATGMNTELGKIAHMLQTAQQSATPLEKKLQVFSKKLILLTLILIVPIFISKFFMAVPWQEVLKTSIALAVAAIPEGLPVVATLALAKGMIKMSRRNVIVKNLSSVETLGGTTIICTDKTGTLTQNKIVVNVLDFPSAWAEVKFTPNNQSMEIVQGDDLSNNLNFLRLKQIATLCNNVQYSISNNEEIYIGDPLEVALLRLAQSSGVNILKYRQQFPKVDELPFRSETKLMASKHCNKESCLVLVKGAIEELLRFCDYIDVNNKIHELKAEEKELWLDRANRLASKGLRILAFAWKNANKDKDEEWLKALTFTAMLGFMDPPASDAEKAIAECKAAGIKVHMVTGDHPYTALNIAKKLKLMSENDFNLINGNEMLPYDELKEEDKVKWLNTYVFARVSPAQKLDLVKVFQEKGHVVGMTGDGVNDAPALKKSDIGIAMGIRGTQVAQESADMILKDDSFSSIVLAIKQGRIIFENIRYSVLYLLSCNMSEIFVISVVALFNTGFQLLPIQILYINLITDVFPALALGFNKGSPFVMNKKPKRPDEPIIQSKHWQSIMVSALLMSLFTLAVVAVDYFFMLPQASANFNIHYNNLLFLTLIASQLLYVFNVHSGKTPFFKNQVVNNLYIWAALAFSLLILMLTFTFEPIMEALHLQELNVRDILLIVIAAFCSMLSIRVMKKMNWIV